jgi:hypothetical protein
MVEGKEMSDIAIELRRALKDIASFHNPAADQGGGQAAARRARATLEYLELLHKDDARRQGLA